MANSIVSLGTLIDQVSSSSDDPVERLAHAARTAGDLSTLGDQLVGHFVDAARASGASWAQIGQSLGGVSKQAAQKRFSPDLSRFTARARETMTAAEAAATEHRHSYIGTEHLLLGLCRDPNSLAAKALAATAGSVDRVVAATVERLGDPSPVRAKPRFTVKSNTALARALSEALDLGHNYIGTEHLLLGLIKGGEVGGDPSLAATILADLGVTYHDVRANLVEQLSAYQ